MNLNFEIVQTADMRCMYAWTLVNGKKVQGRQVFIQKMTELDAICSKCLAFLVKEICNNIYRQRAYTMEMLRSQGSNMNAHWLQNVDALRVQVEILKTTYDFEKVYSKLYAITRCIKDLQPPKHSPLYPTYFAKIEFLEELLLQMQLPFNYKKYLSNTPLKPQQLTLSFS